MTSVGTEVHSIILLSGMQKMAHLPKYHGSMSPMANCSDSINSSGFYRILFFSLVFLALLEERLIIPTVVYPLISQ